MRNHVPALLGYGLRKHSWASIDGALELLIPPFSILIALMLVLLGLSLLSGVTGLIVVAAIGLVAQCLYTLRGVMLASKRYPHVYPALLFVPAFVLWRLWLYAAVLTRRGPVQWTRTVRTPAKSTPVSRVCIIRHYYYPEDPRSRREAEALAAAGHHVDLLALRKPGEPVREVINGVHVRRLPVQHYRGSLLHYVYEYGAFFTLSFFILTARFFPTPVRCRAGQFPARLPGLLRRGLQAVQGEACARYARMHARTLLHQVQGVARPSRGARVRVD